MPGRARRLARACVLISGRGSNMEALVRGARGYTVEAVISDRAGAAGSPPTTPAQNHRIRDMGRGF